MIDNYLKELDDFIFTAEEIINVEVVRRSVWDTDLEKIGIYRYRIYLCDGSLLELTERIIEEDGTLKRKKYHQCFRSGYRQFHRRYPGDAGIQRFFRSTH